MDTEDWVRMRIMVLEFCAACFWENYYDSGQGKIHDGLVDMILFERGVRVHTFMMFVSGSYRPYFTGLQLLNKTLC